MIYRSLFRAYRCSCHCYCQRRQCGRAAFRSTNLPSANGCSWCKWSHLACEQCGYPKFVPRSKDFFNHPLNHPSRKKVAILFPTFLLHLAQNIFVRRPMTESIAKRQTDVAVTSLTSSLQFRNTYSLQCKELPCRNKSCLRP